MREALRPEQAEKFSLPVPEEMCSFLVWGTSSPNADLCIVGTDRFIRLTR